jgi:hypothetical protein
MRVITNTDIIKSRNTWARRVSPIAMFTLLTAFLLNLYSLFRPDHPEYIQYTFILLMVGLVLAMISSNLANRWVREPRADQVLSNTLKKFGKDYVLFNYTISPPHLLLTPSRLYVITVKRQTGQITVKGDRFSRKFAWSRFFRFFGEEGLGVPVVEAQSDANKLQKFLTKKLTDEELPEIKPLVVFVNQDVELSVNDPVIPVMRSNELKTYLRDHDKQRAVSASLRDTLTKIIGSEYQGDSSTKKGF